MRQQIAGVILAGACTLAAGCTNVVGGNAVPADKSGPHGGVPVAVSALERLLLGVDQVNGAMHATKMKVVFDAREMSEAASDVMDKNCRAVDGPAQATVYADTGWTAMRWQGLDDKLKDSKLHVTIQAVVAFPSAREAAAFYKSSAQTWPACSHRTFSDPVPGRADAVWMVAEVTDEGGTLIALKVLEGGDGWACQRALTVRNNIAIDIAACSNSPGSAAKDIAIQIAAKVDKQ